MCVCVRRKQAYWTVAAGAICALLFFTSIAFVFVHLFSPPKVFCFVYFFKVVADVICVPVRKWRGPANNLQDAWCARTVFRVCVCVFSLFGLFTLLGTVFE